MYIFIGITEPVFDRFCLLFQNYKMFEISSYFDIFFINHATSHPIVNSITQTRVSSNLYSKYRQVRTDISKITFWWLLDFTTTTKSFYCKIQKIPWFVTFQIATTFGETLHDDGSWYPKPPRQTPAWLFLSLVQV